MVDSSENPGSYIIGILRNLNKNEMGYMWTLVEMELSLMYDILYTKALVLHTMPGYCIRIISSFTVVASLLLFQFYSRGEHNCGRCYHLCLVGQCLPHGDDIAADRILVYLDILLSLCNTVEWSSAFCFLFAGLPTVLESLASSCHQGGGQAPCGNITCWRCALQGLACWQGSWAIACQLLVFQMA
jgi:hypothetical protein